MSEKTIGTITLNPSIDQHILVRNLVKDDANRALSVGRYPGGKGVNVSKVVRELGGHTHAFALLGGSPGMFWKDLIKDLDIPYSAQIIKDRTRINTILTDLKDKTQTRISAPGPHVSAEELLAFEKLLWKTRSKPAFWAFGGSLAPGMKPRTYYEMISRLQARGVPCLLDADNEALKWGVRAKPFAIKPNEYEMERLTGKKFTSVKSYVPAAQRLVKEGVRVVIVSLGKKGSLFVTRDEVFQVTVPRVPVKSKVGAGDSMIGGFLLGLTRGQSLREAARLGAAASVSAVMRESPRLCLKSDISRLLKRIKIRTL
ncbi:MAG: 1-phosphofructokinase family hexose kinase [Candidatus Omnitrophica bacterium]|nr:1-phosphofructokinase family hexose kinase [Candidatus Omnitrophota bacterium]